MTDQRMALLVRLEQAAGSTEPDVVREALRWAIEELMEADVTEQLGAGPHERTPERLGQRNGHRPRLFDSRVGALELAIPKLRTGSYFPDWLLEPRRRAERALVAVERRDRPVPRDEVVDIELADPLERLEPLVDVRRHQPRLALAEDRVAGEDRALLGHVDGDLAGRVPGRVQDVERVVADAERQVPSEDERALVRIGVVGLAVGHDRGRLRVVGGDGLERVGEWIEVGRRDHEALEQPVVLDDRHAPPAALRLPVRFPGTAPGIAPQTGSTVISAPSGEIWNGRSKPSAKGLVHSWRPASPTCPPNLGRYGRNVEKPDSTRWRARRGHDETASLSGPALHHQLVFGSATSRMGHEIWLEG